MLMWFCVIVGTALLAAGIYGGMKLFGRMALERDEAERARLAEQWKRRAAERKARMEGTAPPAEGDEGAPPVV